MVSMYEVGFDYDAFVKELVATGRYDDEREVIRTALRLLYDEEVVRASRLAELEELVAPALAEIDRGEVLTIEEVEAKFEAKVAAGRGRTAAAE